MKPNKKSSLNNPELTAALPPISAQMQAFMEKSFTPHPGRWFYHLDQFQADIDSQLLVRGLVEREEVEVKGLKLHRYRLAQSIPE
jgi:hypothetical protein